MKTQTNMGQVNDALKCINNIHLHKKFGFLF